MRFFHFIRENAKNHNFLTKNFNSKTTVKSFAKFFFEISKFWFWRFKNRTTVFSVKKIGTLRSFFLRENHRRFPAVPPRHFLIKIYREYRSSSSGILRILYTFSKCQIHREYRSSNYGNLYKPLFWSIFTFFWHPFFTVTSCFPPFFKKPPKSPKSLPVNFPKFT